MSRAEFIKTWIAGLMAVVLSLLPHREKEPLSKAEAVDTSLYPSTQFFHPTSNFSYSTWNGNVYTIVNSVSSSMDNTAWTVIRPDAG